jgi:hypothetical protein
MERDNIPLGLLWEGTCESTLEPFGQLAIGVGEVGEQFEVHIGEGMIETR